MKYHCEFEPDNYLWVASTKVERFIIGVEVNGDFHVLKPKTKDAIAFAREILALCGEIE